MTNVAAIPTVRIRPDYSVPRVIIGAWQLSDGHTDRKIDRAQIFATYDRLVDLGLNTFDCADIYTGVEEMLGEYLRRRRDRYGEAGIENIKIHTKFVPNLDTLSTLTHDDVARIIDRSRTRLAVDRLDMVQFAWWDYNVARYVDTALWLTELSLAGQINLIGATNFDHLRLAQMLEAGVPLSLHQLQYSVLDSRPRGDMTTFSAEHGLWMAAYGTLAGGFLSDRYVGSAEVGEPFENRSLRKYKLIIEEFGGWQRFQDCLATLQAIANKHQVAIASVAMRFILDSHCVAAVILGTRSQKHIDGILEVFRLRLDEEDQTTIQAVITEAAGPRGNVFELERDRDGAHGRIMKYNLNET